MSTIQKKEGLGIVDLGAEEGLEEFKVSNKIALIDA